MDRDGWKSAVWTTLVGHRYMHDVWRNMCDTSSVFSHIFFIQTPLGTTMSTSGVHFKLGWNKYLIVAVCVCDRPKFVFRLMDDSFQHASYWCQIYSPCARQWWYRTLPLWLWIWGCEGVACAILRIVHHECNLILSCKRATVCAPVNMYVVEHFHDIDVWLG